VPHTEKKVKGFAELVNEKNMFFSWDTRNVEIVARDSSILLALSQFCHEKHIHSSAHQHTSTSKNQHIYLESTQKAPRPNLYLSKRRLPYSGLKCDV
jgi:hypothetical protein